MEVKVLLPVPVEALQKIINDACRYAERQFPDESHYSMKRERIRNEYIGEEIMQRVTLEA